MKINIDKLRDKVKFTFTAEYEDQDPAEHFSSREDAEFALSCDYSPHPGWFCSNIVASYKNIKGEHQYLGCCSYNSYEEFTDAEDSYYQDQCEQAFDSLVQNLQDLISDLEDIVD